MRSVVITVILLAQALTIACADSNKSVSKAEANPDFYIPQSQTTDPGELARLYRDLPAENSGICELIKKQFIHPLEVGPYRDVIPEERYFEGTVYHSVRALLSGLLKHDSTGLTLEREPQKRLVVACLHHSLLFASILRERGIPVRMRVGFAPYIGRMVGKDVNISHVVCEVWNDDDSRWMYVDPDRHMVDFPSDDFITGAEAWRQLRAHDLDISKFRSAFFEEEQSVLDMLRLDLLYGLREEVMYWGDSGAPEIPRYRELTGAERRVLDRIAQLLERAGANIEELRILRDSVRYLR
jgi:hypothetical protein